MRIVPLLAIAISAHIAHADTAPHVGLTIDAGVPDGAGTALVVRPIRALRLDAGIGYNGITRGYRAGATLIPFGTWFTPTVSVDVGMFPEGDANPLARMVSGDPTYTSATLERVGYRFANLHVGLEFGAKWATFYIHGGVSRITGRIHDLVSPPDMASSTSVTVGDPVVDLTTISARVGLIIYFL